MRSYLCGIHDDEHFDRDDYFKVTTLHDACRECKLVPGIACICCGAVKVVN